MKFPNVYFRNEGSLAPSWLPFVLYQIYLYAPILVFSTSLRVLDLLIFTSTDILHLKEWGAYCRGVPWSLYSRPPASDRRDDAAAPKPFGEASPSPSAEILDPNRSSSTSWRSLGGATGEGTELREPLVSHVRGRTLLSMHGRRHTIIRLCRL